MLVIALDGWTDAGMASTGAVSYIKEKLASELLLSLDSTALSGTIIATVTSFIVGYAVIAGLLRYLNKGSFMPFVIWRLVVGVALLVMLSNGWITA